MGDDEPDQAQGNRDKLVGRLQGKFGWIKKEAEEQVDDFAEGVNDQIRRL